MRNRNALLFVSIVLFIAVAVIAPMRVSATWSLTIVLAAVAAFVMAAGYAVKGSPWAALVTSLNTMSLSRTQTVVWTILICASFITVAFARFRTTGTAADALTFTVPDTLLGLIGVTLTSAVASSLVLSGKASKSPAADLVQQAAKNANMNPEEVKPQGTLFGYTDGSRAALTDIFEGDELGDAHTLDLGKIQMFFFTVVGATIFLGDMYGRLRSGTPAGLPDLPANLVILMGMSHAGYVGNKLVSRTPEAGAPQPTGDAGRVVPAGQQLPADASDAPRMPIGG